MEAALAEAPQPSSPAAAPDAHAVATEPVIHADDSGDKPLGDFGTPDPAAEPEPPRKFVPPSKREPPKSTAKEPTVEPPKESKAEKPSAEPEKAEEFNPDKMAPKELREAVKRFRKQTQDLEKKISEFKAKPAAPADDPEKKVFQEKLAAAEKRLAEFEEDLKFRDFKSSKDYQRDYNAPFESAYNAGRKHVSRLMATMPDGTTRDATEKDFDNIARMAGYDYNQAAQVAEEMFGPVKAATVLNHLDRARELLDRANAAQEEWKVKGNEREKARAAESQKFQEAVASEVKTHWQQSVADAQKKYQQWSSPVDGDDEGNALLEKGYKLANEAFASFDVMNPKLDKQQRAALVAKHAAVFNRSAWFDRLAFKHAATLKEVKALQTKLAEYQGSTPKGGEGGRGVPAGDADGDQSLSAMAAAGKLGR